MRALTALVVVAIASPASAKAVDPVAIRPDTQDATPTISIGTPNQRARVVAVVANLTVLQGRIAMTLRLDLTGADAEARDVTIPLQLPAGSRPIGMDVQIDKVTTPAVLLGAAEARSFYDQTVRRWRDPGLLELRTGNQFALHVYPIANKGIQKVELSILLPRSPTLAIATTAPLSVDLEADGTGTTRHLIGAAARRFALPAPAPGIVEDPALDRPSVDGTRSLVAGGTAAPIALPTVTIDGSSYCGGMRWVDKTMIRRRIKLMMPKLTYCYERELLRDKTLAGTVGVHFAIEEDGSARVFATDGTLDDQAVRSCVAKVFEQIEFPRGDGRTIVNYPLTYRRADY